MSSHAPVPIDQLLAQREWVRRVARAMVRDENDADDLEQGLWLDALRHPPRNGRSLRGWLFTALRRDRANARRSEASRAGREQAMARAEAIPSAEELIAKADALKRVVVAVMDLAEPYRATVLYRYFEDLSPSEIADRQGVPVETVRTRLKRAIHLLRERFDAESDGDRAAWTSALVPLLPGRGIGDSQGSTVAAKIAGGLAMKAKTKLAVAALLLLLGGVAGWELAGPAAGARADGQDAIAVAGRGFRSDGAVAEEADAARTAASPTAATHRPPADDDARSARTNAGESAGGNAAPPRTAEVAATAPTKPATTAAPDLPEGPAKTGEIVGRVLLAPRRTPVAGAVVTVRDYDAPRSVTTGANGVFRLMSGRTGDGHLFIDAALEGHAPRRLYVRVPPAGGVNGLEVVFGDGGAVEGRVVGADGPIAAAEVSINSAIQGTDKQGRYRIEDVPGGRIGVTLSIGNSAGGDVVRRGKHGDVFAGRTTRVDFDLGATASIVGSVVEDGFPVPGVGVTVSSGSSYFDGGASAYAKTNDDGEFQLQGLVPGEVTVRVRHYDLDDMRQDMIAVKTLTLVPGENRVVLGAGEGDLGCAVSGRILAKSTNAPVDSASLTLYALEEKAPGAWVATSPEGTASGTSGRTGAYEFRGLPVGHYRLVAKPSMRTHPGEGVVDFDLAAGERKTELDVAMGDRPPRDTPGAGILAGVVRDAAGELATAGWIDVYETSTERRSSTMIEAAGVYTVEGVVPSRCRVVYRCDESECEVAETTIVPGANTLDVRLGPGEVRGRVHAGDRGVGKADVNVTASIAKPDGSTRYVGAAWARSDGTFRFVGLPEGTLRLVATPFIGGLRAATANVNVDARVPTLDVDLALDATPTGAVALVVLDESGAEVKWLVVEALVNGRPDAGSRVRLGSLTGTYVLPAAPGPWAFSLWTPDGRYAGSATGQVGGGVAVRAGVVVHARKVEGTPR